MRCAFCGRPLDPRQAWKSANKQLYCSEFCADSEEAAPARPNLIQLHRERPYERLERLLPYMRRYSGRAPLDALPRAAGRS
jgi:hypothetical protein